MNGNLFNKWNEKIKILFLNYNFDFKYQKKHKNHATIRLSEIYTIWTIEHIIIEKIKDFPYEKVISKK